MLLLEHCHSVVCLFDATRISIAHSRLQPFHQLVRKSLPSDAQVACFSAGGDFDEAAAMANASPTKLPSQGSALMAGRKASLSLCIGVGYVQKGTSS